MYLCVPYKSHTRILALHKRYKPSRYHKTFRNCSLACKRLLFYPIAPDALSATSYLLHALGPTSHSQPASQTVSLYYNKTSTEMPLWGVAFVWQLPSIILVSTETHINSRTCALPPCLHSPLEEEFAAFNHIKQRRRQAKRKTTTKAPRKLSALLIG